MNLPRRGRPRVSLRLLAVACVAAIVTPLLRAADWPMWGGTPSRNMFSAERNLPASADLGKARDSGDDGKIDLSTAKNVKWAAKLGNTTYGNPTVAGGRVFVGTNNGSP